MCTGHTGGHHATGSTSVCRTGAIEMVRSQSGRGRGWSSSLRKEKRKSEERRSDVVP